MSKFQGCQNGGVRGMKENKRRYPGIRGKRPDQKAIRREMAVERNAAYVQLPIEEKMRRNPGKQLAA